MKRAGLAALVPILFFAACSDDVVYVDNSVPAAPRGLTASYYAGAVTLSWELAPAWNGEPFRVYSKRVTDSGWFFIAEVTSCIDEVCTYQDVNVLGGQRYEYYVAAVGPNGGESASDVVVEVLVPEFVPPPVPAAPLVIALDNANYVTWGPSARGAADFSHYRVYLDDGSSVFILGETDSEGFLDLLAANGNTYVYFVTSVDLDGHESEGSLLAEGTPRPDFSGEWIYDYFAVPQSSGFRFVEDESVLPIVDGDDPFRHFRLETDIDGWWLVPGPEAAVYPAGFQTTALKCGPGADAGCADLSVAPSSGYVAQDIQIGAQESYVLRVVGDDGQLHYGVIRVTLLGFDQNDDPIMIFDWAYQLQAGNPNLAPARVIPATLRSK
jgi:hypothetical protein